MKIEHIPNDWTVTEQGRDTIVFDPDGEKRCGVETNAGTPCRKRPLSGRHRCYLHGGASPRGVNHPNTTHGRYSRALPTRLATRFDELVNDENLLDLRENISILDVRLEELARRIDPGDYGATYGKLEGLYFKAQQALREKDMGRFAEHWQEIGTLIEQGRRDYAVWQQILNVNDRRRQMVKTVEDIRLRGQNAIALDTFVLIMMRLGDIFDRVNRLEHESERRRAFVTEVDKLLDQPAS